VIKLPKVNIYFARIYILKKLPDSEKKPEIKSKQIERRKVARIDQFSAASKVTMQDIATLVGVSRITVSKYFNGNQGIKAETRKRIEEVCAELNYVPDQNAVRLVKGKANLIGVIIPVLTEPFFAEVLSVIGDEAAMMGLRVVIFCSYNDPAREAAALLAMRSTKAHGVIITPVLSQRNAELLSQLENEMRIVFLDSYLSPNCHYVMNDNLQSIGLLTRYLLSRDHNPAFLAAPAVAYPSGPERIAGYSEAMREAGCEPVFVPVTGAEATWDFEAFAMHHTLNMLGSGAWLKEKRTALICATDRLAIGAMAAFRKFGLEPGRDVAFVGHDDLPVCEYLNPSLTTVKQDVVGIGRAVMECMKHESSMLTSQSAYFQKKFNARLIVRESA
jgi:DNA-binding LacI/PurR family transcriptional regulator